LTDFELVDKGVRPNRKKPQWVTSYNMASIQNIIEKMWLMGPLRNFWEGSFRGEGFLRFVKPEINGGLRKLWSVALMNRLNKKKALSCILRETTVTDDTEDIGEIDWSLVEGGETMKKMMMEMEEDEEEPDEDDDENPQTVNVGEFNSHVYEKFIELWEKYECISVVVLGDGSIKVVIDNGSNWMDVFVRPKKKTQFTQKERNDIQLL